VVVALGFALWSVLHVPSTPVLPPDSGSRVDVTNGEQTDNTLPSRIHDAPSSEHLGGQEPSKDDKRNQLASRLADQLSRFEGGDSVEWLDFLTDFDPIDFEGRQRFDILADRLHTNASQLREYIDGLRDSDPRKIAAILCLPYVEGFDNPTASYLLTKASTTEPRDSKARIVQSLAAIHALRLHGEWAAIGNLVSQLATSQGGLSDTLQGDNRALVLALYLQNQDSITADTSSRISELLTMTKYPEVRRAAIAAHARDTQGNGPADVIRLALQGDDDAISSLKLISDEHSASKLIGLITSIPVEIEANKEMLVGAFGGLLASPSDETLEFVTQVLGHGSEVAGATRAGVDEAAQEAIDKVQDPRALPMVFELGRVFSDDEKLKQKLREAVDRCSKGLTWRTLSVSDRKLLTTSLRRMLLTAQARKDGLLDIAYTLVLVGNDDDFSFVESQLTGSPEMDQLKTMTSPRRRHEK